MIENVQLISFNSRPHEEVDARSGLSGAYPSGFQFTTSRGGRLSMIGPPSMFIYLSIHDLTRRSTDIVCAGVTALTPFNSRPHEEVDVCFRSYRIVKRNFQFTTSRGGRLQAGRGMTVELSLSIHDLTRRSTAPTTIESNQYFSFNSRPHEEVDNSSFLFSSVMSFFQFTTSRGGRQA